VLQQCREPGAVRSAGSAQAAVCDRCRLRRRRGSRELEYEGLSGLWEGYGAHARGIEDRGGVVFALDDDGATLWARCGNDARVVRAARSGKWRALVGSRVGGNNIPCAEARRGCGVYDVDVGHDLEWLKGAWGAVAQVLWRNARVWSGAICSGVWTKGRLRL